MNTRTDLLLTRAGISYRQYDYWIRRGWLKPRFCTRGKSSTAIDHGGSGVSRDLAPGEEPIAILMGRLVNTGIRPETAAFAARNAEEHDGMLRCPLGEGIDLVIGEWVAV